MEHQHQITNLSFQNDEMTFPPTIEVEMTEVLSIDTSKTNIAIAIEGQMLVKEIVERASALFKSLQSAEVLNLEKAGNVEKQQQMSEKTQETLESLKELMGKLRNTYEETRRRMPDIHNVLTNGNIEV